MAKETRNRNIDETLRPSGALLAVQTALSKAIERDAVDPSGYDATTLDLLVRLKLAPDNQLRAVELCQQLLLSPSHISRRIDRAQHAGLVARHLDPNDRRARLVALSAAGSQVIDRFMPQLESVLQQIIFDTLTEPEIETLVELLNRIELAARSTRGQTS